MMRAGSAGNWSILTNAIPTNFGRKTGILFLAMNAFLAGKSQPA
jgi:hypothetical protein